MKNNHLRYVLFSIMCITQWWIPFSMISDHNNILEKGKPFRFKTAPIDPIDPFRGNYVQLHFEQNEYKTEDKTEFSYDDPVYVILKTSESGYAEIDSLTDIRPDQTTDYIQAKVNYIQRDSLTTIVVEYPFSRFYMEEYKAPAAEQTYREVQTDSTKVAYALVRIKNGHSALENVFINDIPLQEIVAKRR